VLVTASATEVRPAEFVISIRVRPFGGDMDLPLNVTCLVFLEDPYSGDKAPLENGGPRRAHRPRARRPPHELTPRCKESFQAIKRLKGLLACT
jgi:hypothetical protein